MDRYDETNIHFSAKNWKKCVIYFGIRIRIASKIFTAVSAHLFTFKATTHTGQNML